MISKRHLKTERYEYCWFIDRVNELKPDMGLDRAVSQAIDEMPDGFIIAPLIKPEKAKVFMMLRTEYDREAFAKSVYDEGKAEELAQGKAEVPQYSDKLLDAANEARRISRDSSIKGYKTMDDLKKALED